ncbi:MAG: hypothetical protein V8S90_13585 [Lachnospiraceae bacterium]
MGKVIGIVVPDDCKNIYVFQSNQEFTDQITSRRMKALYGDKDYQKEKAMYIAYPSKEG